MLVAYRKSEGMKNKDFSRARMTTTVSVGESVRIIRELQDLSQNQLSSLTGIPQSTISAIESGRVNLGVERAKVIARALSCHPAVLVFPGWDVNKSTRCQSRSAGRSRARFCAVPPRRGTARWRTRKLVALADEVFRELDHTEEPR